MKPTPTHSNPTTDHRPLNGHAVVPEVGVGRLLDATAVVMGRVGSVSNDITDRATRLAAQELADRAEDRLPTRPGSAVQAWRKLFGRGTRLRKPTRPESTPTTGADSAPDNQAGESLAADSPLPRPAPIPTSLARLFFAFNAAVAALALWGQAGGLVRLLYGDKAVKTFQPETWQDYAKFYAVPVVFALVIELLAMLLQRWADWRRIDHGERALIAYGAAFAVAGAVVGLNYYGHHGGRAGALFAGASAATFAMYTIKSIARRRDALKARGKLVDIPLGTTPRLAARARELAQREPGLEGWQYVDQAREQFAAESRRAAIRALVVDIVRERRGEQEAKLAELVYPVDEIADILGGSIAADPVAAEIRERITDPSTDSEVDRALRQADSEFHAAAARLDSQADSVEPTPTRPRRRWRRADSDPRPDSEPTPTPTVEESGTDPTRGPDSDPRPTPTVEPTRPEADRKPTPTRSRPAAKPTPTRPRSVDNLPTDDEVITRLRELYPNTAPNWPQVRAVALGSKGRTKRLRELYLDDLAARQSA